MGLKNDNWKDKPLLIKKKEKEKETNSGYGSTKLFMCNAVVRVRTISMLQIDSGIYFTLILHWIPTQIQVFPQCFPSGNSCCNGKCFIDRSVPVPSSAAHLPDPIPFLGAGANY